MDFLQRDKFTGLTIPSFEDLFPCALAKTAKFGMKGDGGEAKEGDREGQEVDSTYSSIGTFSQLEPVLVKMYFTL